MVTSASRRDHGSSHGVDSDRAYVQAMEHLVHVVQQLSLTRDLDGIMAVVRRAARELTGADGATFILRDGDKCHYADEDAIAPLWKERRFPMTACISGWAMLNRRQVVIEDIYEDARIPHDAYRPTFVKSLVMVPIRTLDPIGAIGNYWAQGHAASEQEVHLLQALADTTAVALENAQVYGELERRVRDRTAALRAANEELDSFNYSVSHDLRAPVRAIAGYCRLLEQDHRETLDTEVRRKLAIVGAEADRLGALIEGLLNLSRLGRENLRHGPVDMTALARAAFERLEAGLQDATVDFQLAQLPPVDGDRTLLEQVWTNLLSNAIKFSSGKERPSIEVGAETSASEQAYWVRDNGVGFDPKYSEKLFTVFQRLHHDADFPGTGVGLALVRRIVTRHGGRIWADSEPGKGATFGFALPKATEQPG